MELFGIGPLELIFILIIALIVLGPRDMVKAGHTLGRLMRKTILSPTWLKIQREIRTLPYQMMRDAGLEDEDLRIDMNLATPKKPPNTITSLPEHYQAPPPAAPEENTIGQNPDIPQEWLGLPPAGEGESNGKHPSEDLSSLSDWTSSPEIETMPNNPAPVIPDEDPDEAKDPA